jgi:hypothetical protein
MILAHITRKSGSVRFLLRSKIFSGWFLNNTILTKDNIIKRKWQGDPTCYFCLMDESASHLLFYCNIAKTVWATFATCIGADDIPSSLASVGCGVRYGSLVVRNFILGKLIQNPISIVCHAC